MKRMIALFLLLALCLCACSTGQPAKPTGLPADGTVTYTVKVEDESGAPVAGAVVQWCLDVCSPGVTDAEGLARYTAPEAAYEVKLLSVPEGFAADDRVYTYETGKHALTIVLKTG